MLKVIAPGKLILSGEHAVVYGYPALAAAVDRYVHLIVKKNRSGLLVEPFQARGVVKSAIQKVHFSLKEKPNYNYSIKVHSTIPIGCGMGSSAAFAVALSASILKYSNKPWNAGLVNDLAYEIEKKYHGQPSGVDNTISTKGGYLWYRRESEKVKLFHQIEVRKKLGNLYIINSGKPKESTGEMVRLVRRLYEKRQLYVKNVFSEMEKVSRGFLRYLLGEKSNEIAGLIKENQKLLERLGVVSFSTKKLVKEIEKIGGAAKVSGAGGVKRSSGILLVFHRDYGKLSEFAQRHSLDVEKVVLGRRGLKVEKIN